MKKLGITIFLVLVGLSSLGAVEPLRPSVGSVEADEGLEVRPRITHEELSKLQRPRDPNLKDRSVRLFDIERPRSEKVNPEGGSQLARSRESLVSRSTVVSGSSSWTIVPRGAVLLTPARFRGRVDRERRGKLVTWQDFYAKNTSWIRLLPVTLDQATGRVPLTGDYLASLERTGLLVVAVCDGGPISVRFPEEGKELAPLSRPVKAAEWKDPSRR